MLGKYLYYEEPGIQIYCGDCREILPLIDPATVDLVLTDPPYGMGAVFDRKGIRRPSLESKTATSRGWGSIVGDDEPFDPSSLLFFRRLALFGANHYADRLPRSSKWLVWDKRCGTPPDNNSDAELIWTNLEGAVRIHRQKWRGLIREGEENLSRGWKLHPAQKPIALIKWIIGLFDLKPGSLIFDPYMGSGMTLRAAKDMGYRAIGIEIKEKFCKVTVDRLRQEVLL
ncbi:DNA-methyltransferase [Candidatus Manganitrophus noduliformans]|uniref:Methyltransferase n=1 Tax=Candidatus Manganitrophus noduliformans TaxID=2606439 RepID=A0A7X6DMJ3_9BACT|nr:site-specific DNA-methyltransferase [Candidatus Manganitrophus noduliformans]NKE69862.1 site-specific DNA-methyltransferase [Candidatus Manganitrophus noduliformans]